MENKSFPRFLTLQGHRQPLSNSSVTVCFTAVRKPVLLNPPSSLFLAFCIMTDDRILLKGLFKIQTKRYLNFLSLNNTKCRNVSDHFYLITAWSQTLYTKTTISRSDMLAVQKHTHTLIFCLQCHLTDLFHPIPLI